MDNPAWRIALQASLDAGADAPASRYAQLATVRPDGRPASRTLVFRGFLDGGNALAFAVDVRSAKMDDIGASPFGELCWYFGESREQFRLSGPLRSIGEGSSGSDRDERARVWASMSDTARRQYDWPDPGAPRSAPADPPTAPPDPARPSPRFAVLILDPDRVDQLALRGEPQERTIHERIDPSSWTSRPVNP